VGELSEGAILALDQGTTNTKAMLVDPASGAVVVAASRPVDVRFPGAGLVEQDASQLWSATLAAAAECLARRPEAALVGLSISNQRESVVCWERSSGRPLGPVLGWQDARTAAWCADLADKHPGATSEVRLRTGLTLDPMFSAPKMRYALDAATAAGSQISDVVVGTVDAWLVCRLTGELAIEVGNASRTLLLDLENLEWDPELLDLFGVPIGVLPEVRPSDAGFGRTSALPGIPEGVPVAAVLADSHAALYYHGCTTPGTGKATYGTGSSVMSPVAARGNAPDGIATTLAWHAGGNPTYAREGNILASGSALDWTAATLGSSGEVPGGEFLTELAARVSSTDGVYLVPAFTGLGAPYWDRSASGILTGLNAGTTRAHVARAALEAVAHQVVDVVEAIESDGEARIDELKADGGATASALLMQLQADLLGRPVHVADAPEASALGAALLAARTLGYSGPQPTATREVWPRVGDPRAARDEWGRAVSRSRGLAVRPALDPLAQERSHPPP
jgi:glycerol kinase